MRTSLVTVDNVADLIVKMEESEWQGFFVEDEERGIVEWREMHFEFSPEDFQKVMRAYESYYRRLYPRG